MRKDGARLSCTETATTPCSWAAEIQIRNDRERWEDGAGVTESPVGLGELANGRNKHLLCHGMEIPQRRFGKTNHFLEGKSIVVEHRIQVQALNPPRGVRKNVNRIDADIPGERI